ncbi:unnamed protein product [Meganyctiphanes norvegica]|uniref:Uncharacterized protein n=1 Tax=Meganyctiphanes norvegica TaxID=48144 RepID=A0AAV2PGV4_MEGNR
MELLENVPKLYVKGCYSTINQDYEIKIKSIHGDHLMSAHCHHTNWGGWPEERFTMYQPDGRWVVELKGESTGCCSCSGGNNLNTEVGGPNGNVFGLLKGQLSDILLATSSNDFLGQIKGGLFTSNKTIWKYIQDRSRM